MPNAGRGVVVAIHLVTVVIHLAVAVLLAVAQAVQAVHSVPSLLVVVMGRVLARASHPGPNAIKTHRTVTSHRHARMQGRGQGAM